MGARWAEMAATSLKESSDSCIHSACISPNCVSGSVLFFSRTFDWETQLLPGGILDALCGRCCEGPSVRGAPVGGSQVL